MNILYIGYKDEYDVDILLSLSKKHNVTVLSEKECCVETDCSFIVVDSVINSAYFSGDYDLVVIKENEFVAEKINSLLSLCYSAEIGKVLILSNSDLFNVNNEAMNLTYMLTCKYNDELGLDVSVIKTPCFYGHNPPREFVGISRSALTKNTIVLKKQDKYDLLSIEDFCTYFSDALDDVNSSFKKKFVNVQSSYPFEFKRFVEKLESRYSGVYISVSENKENGTNALDEYNTETITVNSSSVVSEFDNIFLLAEKCVYENGYRKKKKTGNIISKLAILLFVFIIIAFYTVLAPSGAQLQFVDVRFIFLVFSALIFGKNYGYISAGLCSALFIFENLYNGNAWYTLFYNVNNWITVIVYIASAMALGMILSKRENKE